MVCKHKGHSLLGQGLFAPFSWRLSTNYQDLGTNSAFSIRRIWSWEYCILKISGAQDPVEFSKINGLLSANGLLSTKIKVVVSNIFIFTPTWGNDPIWLIFLNWDETTNQKSTRTSHGLFFVEIIYLRYSLEAWWIIHCLSNRFPGRKGLIAERSDDILDPWLLFVGRASGRCEEKGLKVHDLDKYWTPLRGKMELERYRFTKDVFFSRDPFSRSTVFLFLGGVECRLVFLGWQIWVHSFIMVKACQSSIIVIIGLVQLLTFVNTAGNSVLVRIECRIYSLVQHLMSYSGFMVLIVWDLLLNTIDISAVY